MIVLNETPVRTVRSFNINNIKLENIEIPEVIGEFENVMFANCNSKIKIEKDGGNYKLAYGLGDFFTKQVEEKANQKIRLLIEEKIEEPLKICFGFDEKNVSLVEDIEIVAKDNANATVVIQYQAEEKLACFHNGRIHVCASKNATIKLIFVNLMNEVSNHFIAIQNDLQEKANVQYTVIDFGGKNSITNLYSNLQGNEAENSIHTIYLGKEKQLFDLNYMAELHGEKSNVEIEVQGALKDFSKKHFKGTIDFQKGCKKAKGNENEACMLLSDTAKSIALPMLLCSEEEVEGNHSSSAGKVGEKELFYMMSRGFEPKEAEKLMVRAKFNGILEKMENEEMKTFILQKIDEKLD